MGNPPNRRGILFAGQYFLVFSRKIRKLGGLFFSPYTDGRGIVFLFGVYPITSWKSRPELRKCVTGLDVDDENFRQGRGELCTQFCSPWVAWQGRTVPTPLRRERNTVRVWFRKCLTESPWRVPREKIDPTECVY